MADGKLVVSPRSFTLSPSGEESAATQLLTVWNESADVLAFKIKSNAPRRFFVRPNNGVLLPGRALDVEISLQPASAEHLTAIVPLGSPLGGSMATGNAFDGANYKFVVLSMRVDARCALDESELSTLWTQTEPRVDVVLHCSLHDEPSSPAQRRAPSRTPRTPLSPGSESLADSDSESHVAEPFRARQSALAVARQLTPLRTGRAERAPLPLRTADDEPQPASGDGASAARRAPAGPSAALSSSPLAHAKALSAEARAAQATRRLLTASTPADAERAPHARAAFGEWAAGEQSRARADAEGRAALLRPPAEGRPARASGAAELASARSPSAAHAQPHYHSEAAAEHGGAGSGAGGGGGGGADGGGSSRGSASTASRSPAQRERMLPLRATLDLHPPLHVQPRAHSPQAQPQGASLGASHCAPIGCRQRSWSALAALSQPSAPGSGLRPSQLPSTASELGALGAAAADGGLRADSPPAPLDGEGGDASSPAVVAALRAELHATRAELERTQQALQRAERARLELRSQCGEMRAQLRAALPQPAPAADGTLTSRVAGRLVAGAAALAYALVAALVAMVQAALRVWGRGTRQEQVSLMVVNALAFLVVSALI